MGRFDADLFVKVFKKKGCHIGKACKAVGITRAHYYHMKKKDRNFAQRLEEVRESLLDDVESILVENIKAGDTKALMFFLSTKGKHRGYIKDPRIEINNNLELGDNRQATLSIYQEASDRQRKRLAIIKTLLDLDDESVVSEQ